MEGFNELFPTCFNQLDLPEYSTNEQLQELIACNFFKPLISYVDAFLISCANLLEELRNLSKKINQTIDLSDFTSQNDESETTNVDSQVPEKMQNVSNIPNGSIDH